MKNTNMNGQNIRKTMAAAIAALTMVISTSCSSIPELSAAAPAQTPSSQTQVQPADTTPAETSTETAPETSAPESEAPAETSSAQDSSAAGKPAKNPAQNSSTAEKPSKKPAQTTESKPAPAAEQIPTDILDVTAEDIDLTVEQFIALTGGNFNIGASAWFKDEGAVSITSERMPGLVYIATISDYTKGVPQNANEVADPENPGYKYVFFEGAYPRMIVVSWGGRLNSQAAVGMTSTQLRDIYGEDFKVIFHGWTDEDFDHCTVEPGSGRNWYFDFDTEDIDDSLKEILAQRLAENPEGADVTDLGLTCTQIYMIRS